MYVGETVHFRLLCAQTTTGTVFFITNESEPDVPVDFYVFQSDGITYAEGALKMNSIVSKYINHLSFFLPHCIY